MNPDKAVQQFMKDTELCDDKLVKPQLHNLKARIEDMVARHSYQNTSACNLQTQIVVDLCLVVYFCYKSHIV
jgi:hypothetical protein